MVSETDQAVVGARSGSGRGAGGRFPGRRLRRIGAWTVAALLILAVGGTIGLGWYVSVLNLEPHHAGSARSDFALGVGGTDAAPTVVLTESKATLRPGVHGLSWGGGAAMIGDVVSRSPGRVERVLLRGTPPPTGIAVGVAWNYPQDPRSLLDLTIREISVPTELGPAPAWYIPGSGPAGRTWVISVHGQNGTLASTMDGIPTMHRLGLSVLTISYRNDVAAPPSPDGLMHLGESEWRDVDAAIRTARSMGAQRIVLDGSSMGGSIVGQTLVHSSQAHLVDAVVMDAPGLDYELTGRAASSRMGVPPFLVRPIGWIMEWRLGFAIDELNLVENPPDVRPPLLLIHGTADEEHPVQESRNLAAAADRLGWPIRYEEFPGAGHTQSWNIDRDRYERVLAEFLTRVLDL